MEILRQVGDKLIEYGEKLLYVSLVKDLGLTEVPIEKIDPQKFKENVYNPYFDSLMKKSFEERRKFIDKKLSKIPKVRHDAAEKFLRQGIRDYYDRKLKSKKP